MNPYHRLVAEMARLVREGKRHPLGNWPPAPRSALGPAAGKALIFSPHPDDECIIGGLALRLLRQARMTVVNVAVTQGSNRARQAGRWQELQGACQFLGFELVATGPNGLEKINPKTRALDAATWAPMVETIANLLRAHQPRLIFFPHEFDWNSTHIGTHFLVMDALAALGTTIECLLVETEFWGQMNTPNLMVESTPEDVADLVTATSFHVGEVQRNPYHLLLPAWLLDNVRRGGELVGGQGQAAPQFLFATLYRLRRWTGGRVEATHSGGKFLSASMDPLSLFISG